jgi:hypothetical protein
MIYAFPHKGYIEDENGAFGEANFSGMTLRDYFAAKAMQGLMSRVDHGNGDCVTNASADDVAGYAYCIANAMMKAREQ